MRTIIPANPGFSALEYLDPGDGKPIREYIASPVVAWRLEEEGSPGFAYRCEPWPITAPATPDWHALLLPSGEVEGMEARYDNVLLWLRAVNKMLERDT